ncbi:hypothetical protein U14_02315 [Candidatus Moduliflexus flocculans]|uniref:Uncharacterized protein n=1 Tax=Candidatus Moduliflexus flocculans TaxID=1499966 RepID=A0A0S6VZ43_9BACT|nr:hypothetical protein U14_02315 [Candidatus Moduliflexus flocculans]
MPNIFDNIEQRLVNALNAALDVAYRADFYQQSAPSFRQIT